MQHDQSQRQKANRLAKEKSPYLLQHQYNPVDWYPWGEEAFEKAKKEDKPIFLSVGYSTCHWCHVMEHESFEDQSTADIMNQHFVSIKVDREERPDVDKIYMTYVQATQGSGGWPMSVFLTPTLHPIVGGTYFPPEDRYGRPGFKTILRNVANLWKTRKSEILQKGAKVMSLIGDHAMDNIKPTGQRLGWQALQKCFAQLARGYDSDQGGFSDHPKFPRPVILLFLMRVYAAGGASQDTRKHALEMTLHTLRKMGAGGMHDHVGGGFHRYSVDSEWHVPHFEKMLYDQAQLAWAYLEAFQITREPLEEKLARDVMDYVRNTITAPSGGIYSAEDADSLPTPDAKKKTEGAFYVWTKADIEAVLGPIDSVIVMYHYGVEAAGNCPEEGDPHGELRGQNVLIERHTLEETAKHFEKTPAQMSDELARCRARLREVRNRRPRPHLDDKIIVAWNALMVTAYAKGYQVLRDPTYLQAARKALTFIRSEMYLADRGVLIRSYREGRSTVEAFVEDYAFLVQALLDMYEADFDVQWLQWAFDLQRKQDELFWDDKHGGYFAVSGNDKSLLLRLKEEYDGAEPSGNSVAVMNLLRLANLTDRADFREKATKSLDAFSKLLTEAPIVMPYMCAALNYSLAAPMHLVISGRIDQPDTQALLHVAQQEFVPNKVLVLADQGDGQTYLQKLLPFISGMGLSNGKAAAYVCQNMSCQLPLTEPAELQLKLSKKL